MSVRPYNFSVPTGEDQYFVTNFAVLGVLKSGGPVVFSVGGGRERIDVTIFYGENLGGGFKPRFGWKSTDKTGQK